MASKNHELGIKVVADARNASKELKEISTQLAQLDDDANISINADASKAEAEVQEMVRKLSSLDREEVVAVLNAESKKLEAEVRRANRLLLDVDGERAEAVLDARDEAKAKIDAIQSELDRLDRKSVDATVAADDKATGDINGVNDKLDKLDRRSVDATIDATEGAGFSSLTDKIENMPIAIGGVGPIVGKLTSPGGAIALLATAFAGAAVSTKNMALDVNSLSNFTGEDFSYTDKFLQVAETWGNLDLNDLFEIIAELQSKLSETPELAEKFGVDPQFVIDHPLQGIVELIDSIRESSLTAAEKAQAMFALFGEEGAKQLIPLLTNVDDLSTMVENMPELVSPADIDNAKAFQKNLNSIKTSLGEIGANVGAPILEVLDPILNVLAQIAKQIPAAWDVLTLDGGVLGPADFSEEFEAFIGLMRTGIEEAKAWEIAYGNMDGYGTFQSMVADATGMIERGIPVVTAMKEVFGATDENALFLALSLGIVTDEQEDLTSATEDSNEAIQEQIDKAKENIEALEELAEATREAADAQLALDDQYEDTKSAVEEYNDTMADSEATEEDKTRATRKARDEVLALADAEVAASVARAASNGTTLSARQQNEMYVNSLLRQSSTLNGPVKAAVLAQIARLLGIPESRVTEIQAMTDPNDLAQVERQLTYLARNRSVYLGIHGPGTTADSGVYRSGSNNMANRARARGEASVSGGRYLVGEEGPEIVDLPVGSRVTDAVHSRHQMGGSGNTTIINNWPAGSVPRDVMRAQRKYARRNL